MPSDFSNKPSPENPERFSLQWRNSLDISALVPTRRTEELRAVRDLIRVHENGRAEKLLSAGFERRDTPDPESARIVERLQTELKRHLGLSSARTVVFSKHEGSLELNIHDSVFRGGNGQLDVLSFIEPKVVCSDGARRWIIPDYEPLSDSRLRPCPYSFENPVCLCVMVVEDEFDFSTVYSPEAFWELRERLEEDFADAPRQMLTAFIQGGADLAAKKKMIPEGVLNTADLALLRPLSSDAKTGHYLVPLRPLGLLDLQLGFDEGTHQLEIQLGIDPFEC